MKKMVIFTSDGASVMQNKGVVTQLKQVISQKVNALLLLIHIICIQYLISMNNIHTHSTVNQVILQTSAKFFYTISYCDLQTLYGK